MSDREWMSGMQPASHQTVLLAEAIEALAIDEAKRASGVYIDGTFGRGGHSRLILEKLDSQGRLIAFDKDPEAVAVARRIEDARFEIVHGSFSELDRVLKARGIETVDGILLDLGISSPQVDEAHRGFSFRLDGPLDMRMNPEVGESAAIWLSRESEEKIAEVIRLYGEERFAVQIAKAIVARRASEPIATTTELAEIVAKAVKTREGGKHPATRTFQAIRIYINQELEELEVGLRKASDRLAVNGRMAVISFHSLEDRLVKQFFTARSHVEKPDRRVPVRAAELPEAEMKLLGKKKPSKEEIAGNPRARSAILRVMQRIGRHEGAT